MKISQKLSVGFAFIVTPITLFSILNVITIQKELKEIGNLHSSNLYLMQNSATKTAEAVEESFAYIASGQKNEKEAFIAWEKEINRKNKEFTKLNDYTYYKDEEETKLFKTILQEQAEFIKKAKEVFNEFETKGFVSNKLFIEYEGLIHKLRSSYKKAIEIEKEEVDNEQKKAIVLINRTLKNLITIGLITIASAILSGYFIAKSISNPIKKLKSAMTEVGKGNLDTLIQPNSKDEIGDLAISFSSMTKDLKKSREELITVRNYTNNILKSMSDNLIVISPEGNIITVNTATCTMLGYEENELIGQPVEKILVEEELLLEKAQIENLFQEGSVSNVEKSYLAKDGIKIPVSFSSSLMLDDNRKIQGIVCVAQDITERKRAELEINNALKKEKELSELKSRFVTMASHEFRTPLATILSSTELIEHYSYKWSEEKKVEHLQRIQTAIKNMTQLLNDVLLIGKAEAGKLEYNPTVLNLAKFCQDIIEEVQAVAGTKHIIAFSSVGQSNTVVMDEKLLRHILTNLLTNAMKYSPQGCALNFNLICDYETAVFSIQDQGIGIPLEDQQKLFETFHRGKNVSTIPGTGLGLAIVKKSVDLHGGNIAVKSEVGVGTTFTVTLPLNKQV